MVCAKHKGIAKRQIAKFRDARRAKKMKKAGGKRAGRDAKAVGSTERLLRPSRRGQTSRDVRPRDGPCAAGAVAAGACAVPRLTLKKKKIDAGESARVRRRHVRQARRSILARMTLDEKLDYLGGADGFYVRAVPRLGLPAFRMADGPFGVRNVGPSTAYPAGIGLAASWDTALASRVGASIGRERARAACKSCWRRA